VIGLGISRSSSILARTSSATSPVALGPRLSSSSPCIVRERSDAFARARSRPAPPASSRTTSSIGGDAVDEAGVDGGLGGQDAALAVAGADGVGRGAAAGGDVADEHAVEVVDLGLERGARLVAERLVEVALDLVRAGG
jgi:hypothetical protein